MKIGIISLYYNNKNIGGLLQCYAMCKIISEIIPGDNHIEQISYDSYVSNENIKQCERKLLKSRIKNIGLKKMINRAKKTITVFFQKKTQKDIQCEIEQKRAFKRFEESIPHSDYIYNVTNIQNANKQYDCFVCGSDQVWNPGKLAHEAYYLSFAGENKKKIPYAVSLGKSVLSNYEQQLLIQRISNIRFLSAREKTACSLISQITGKECVNVLDPTFLLSSSEWEKISNKDIISWDRQYVFAFFLGDCSWQKQFVQAFADSHNLQVVYSPYVTNKKEKNNKFFKGIEIFPMGPREFITIVKNATYVFTDSFHGTAFSLVFNKQFYVFDRDNDKDKTSGNSRLLDLLDELNLKDQYLKSKKEIITNKVIDYKNVNDLLEKRIQSSKAWLKKAILESE